MGKPTIKYLATGDTLSKDYIYRAGEPLASKKDYEPHTLEQTRRYAKTAAKELFYPRVVLELLDDAETIGEINRIMTTARHGGYK